MVILRREERTFWWGEETIKEDTEDTLIRAIVHWGPLDKFWVHWSQVDLLQEPESVWLRWGGPLSSLYRDPAQFRCPRDVTFHVDTGFSWCQCQQQKCLSKGSAGSRCGQVGASTREEEADAQMLMLVTSVNWLPFSKNSHKKDRRRILDEEVLKSYYFSGRIILS